MAPVFGAAVPQAPQFTARPAFLKSALPTASDVQNGNFELTTIATTASAMSPAWGSWAFGPGTGIAGEDSAIASANGAAPNGDYVAYLDSSGEISLSVPVQAGVYRIHYSAARQIESPASDVEGLVRVKFAGRTLSQDEDISESYTEFVSRPIRFNSAGTRTLKITAVGDTPRTILIDQMRVERVREWNEPTTWIVTGNPGTHTAPTSADEVTIPADSVVALSGNRTALNVDVFGELVVPNRNGSLVTELLNVQGVNARFEVGRRGAPYKQDFTLNLSADYNNADEVDADHRALLVGGGAQLELHGKNKLSWTKLITTVDDGDDRIQVAGIEGWEVGDLIVLAGSGGQVYDRTEQAFQDLSEQRRVRAIAQVPNTPTGSPVRYYVDLGSVANASTPDPVLYRHLGGASLKRTVAVGDVSLERELELEQSAEVGVLTRNIVVTSTVTGTIDPVEDFGQDAAPGGHVMVMGSNSDAAVPTGFARVSNVEFTKLGRSRNLGRYPFHWHMVRDNGFGQYLVNSSVHETFNRAITIHGTDGTLVDSNVALHNLGHAVFLEDGSEMDNTITGNLVIATRRPEFARDGVIESDFAPHTFQSRAPSSFWITNPNNTITGNAVANCFGTAYWLIFPKTVLGISRGNMQNTAGHNPTVQPFRQALGAFEGNVAHSCMMGLDIHDGIDLANNGKDGIVERGISWEPPSGFETLKDLTIYACDTAIYGAGTPGSVVYEHCRFGDNQQTLFFAGYDRAIACLFVADSGNGITDSLITGVTMELEAYRVYDGAGSVSKSRFEGYIGTNKRMIRHNRAARRQVNHRFLGNEHYSDATTLAPADIEWLDFACYIGGVGSCPAPGAGQSDPQDSNSWGFVLYDDDGGTFGTAARSIVSNAPLVLVGDETEYVGPTPGPSFAFLTPRRYAHVQIGSPSDHNAQGASGTTPRCEVERLHTNLPTVGHSYEVSTARWQQIPAIVNDENFRYTVNFGSVQLTTNDQPGEYELELAQGDADLGWVSRLEVGNFNFLCDDLASLTVEINGVSAMRAPSLGALHPSVVTQTGWFYDSATGSFHVTFVQTNPAYDSAGVPQAQKRELLELNW